MIATSGSWTSCPTLLDRAWRVALRGGFRLALIWWRLRRPRHRGALVALRVGPRLLVVHSSYRRAWNLPGGGIQRGETPDAAARRELLEEIGLSIDLPACAFVFDGVCEGRREQVSVFEVHLDQMPALKLDGREIVAARLVTPSELDRLAVTRPVAAYIGRLPPKQDPADLA